VRARLAIAVVLALTLAGFASAPAFASDGNGNASPPGQEKQLADTAPPASAASSDQVDTAEPASSPAENGSGTGNSGNGLGNGGGNGNDGNGGNSANAHANAAQNDPSNASSIARVDQPGENGGVDQQNNAQAAADAAAANDAGSAQATAGAVASQDSPANVNISARVNSPGDDGATSQTNSSGANADAAATGTPDSQAQADATATQQSPLNVNVSVRVNSPGNQGSVTQSNSADAVAGETPSTPADGPQSAGDTNSASIDNSAALGQSLEQCGAQCITGPDYDTTASAAPTEQATLATPAAQTVQAPTATTAAAVQQAPTNVNVSVRLASPGSDGAVSQANTATATADEANVTSSDPTNVNIQVTVAGDSGNIAASSNGLPWTWTWNWDLGAGPSDAGTATNDWNWDWTQPATDATSTPTATSAATTAPQPAEGQWIWIFDYTAPDGTHVSVVSNQPCACAWVWSWTWSGAPPTSAPQTQVVAPSAEAAPAPAPQIVQANDAVATANASASTDIEQQASRNAPDFQAADQQIDLTQTADAEAVVDQTGASNSSVVTAGRLSSLEQWNLVSASAMSTADITAKQTSSQSLQLTAGDVAAHQEGASQQMTIVQTAGATARAAQAAAHNRTKIAARGRSEAPIGPISQSNAAGAWTIASSSAAVVQQIAQHQLGEGADQVALAGQDATLIQDAQADAEVAQANLGNTSSVLIPAGGIFNPPISQSNDVHASAQMTNSAVVEQHITQSESGAFITWSATAEQTATVTQSGDASASADQAGIENVAGWTGPIATPFSASASDAAGVGAAPIRLLRSGISGGRGRAVLPPEGTLPVATPAALPPARGGLVLSAPPRSRSQTASTSSTSSSSAAAAPRRMSAPAMSAPRADAAIDIGDCAPFCRGGISGGLIGLAIGVSGAWYALRPRSYKLAAPGVGRLLDDAPALGRSVDLALFERPG
jgi:hypothetical protein